MMYKDESDSISIVKKHLAMSFDVDEKNLSQWLNWHGRSEGKLIRSHLALSSGEALGISKHTAIIWSVVCELIHSALTLRSVKFDDKHYNSLIFKATYTCLLLC